MQMYSLHRNGSVRAAILVLAWAIVASPGPAAAQVPAPPPVGGGVKVVAQGKEKVKDEPGAPDPAPKATKKKTRAGEDKAKAGEDKPEAGAKSPKTDIAADTGTAPETETETNTDTKALPAEPGADLKPEAASSSEEILPPPERQLTISPAVRAKISGAPPEDMATPDKEMEALKTFEEQAFPRPGSKVVLPGDVSGVEGKAAGTRKPRPGADNPPEGLTSEGRLPATEQKPAEEKKEPLPGWISKLTMPDMPVRWTPRLLKYLEFYRSSRRGRSILRRWLARIGRYRTLMESEIKRQKVPRTLIYLAMIESGYDPRRTSRVGAGGLWQFMPFSGRGYGLKRDYWIDERRNPKLSTEAALKYLKDLHTRFGSWELAMASYNAGYGAVQRAIQKYNTNDYWTLCQYEAGLPWSTSLYVPKILAVAVVDANRKFFGYQEVKDDEELTFELVSVSDSVTLAQAARAVGVETKVLDLLNPELRRDRTPPGVKSWLRVPRGTGTKFYAGLAKIKVNLARYRPYVARLGESVRSIARNHGIARGTLRRLNGFTSDSELRPGLTILVPAKAVKKKAPFKKRKGKKDSNQKKVEADAEEDESILAPIPPQAPTKVAGRKRVFYQVVRGDGMKIIAKHLEVSADELAGWNSLDAGAQLISGMILQAFVKEDFSGEKVVLLDPEKVQVMVAGSEKFLNLYEQRKGRKRLTYSARKGDTLRSIGRRVGLTIGDLARINKFSRHTRLDTGQKIIVYMDPAKARQPKKKRRRKKRRGKKRRGKRKKTT